MSKEKIYPKGLITFKPHENAPDFVKGKLIITLKDLIQFCKDNPSLLKEYKGKKQLPLVMTEGKFGISFEVDTWKPEKKQDVLTQQNKEDIDNFNDIDDLPF
jgi:hypothetical protein